jgi:uncharacterized coiled-coil DUF342 family protein
MSSLCSKYFQDDRTFRERITSLSNEVNNIKKILTKCFFRKYLTKDKLDEVETKIFSQILGTNYDELINKFKKIREFLNKININNPRVLST